ncbi:DEAD/DEAH box helicase [Spirosoma utsteinense]|uniref:ATP-dependent RNA helicase RhlE n=1 Tax=Spirosoma utsteinense TaxID=2585773 RepID=A0ABR6W484_9BACT|nr:DEAD/DEAH box helicase [Spirosoma utsteinense]MBC3787061.1 ATP-dependent RNA helicase RhlE [Spirosoma utsteinense]MBC3791390.1 ATP-dependent RNA helicase RhlE [Spirosoma utsteinense]
MSFSTLGLSKPLVEAVAEQHYTKPYPIQEDAIPAILQAKDVLGIARTGSGKTASFVLPILELFHRAKTVKIKRVNVLVLVPTRELAIQVADVFQTFGKALPNPVKTVAIYGGVAVNPQMIAVHGAEIVVATPGRLLDLVSSNALRLSDVEILVLDEADKMLELGFADEMNRVFDLVPAKRQTILFSATLGDAIADINQSLLRNPVTIQIDDEEQDIDLIKQTAYRVDAERKGPLLRYIIKTGKMKQVLVFVSSVRTADNVVTKLSKNGIQAAAIHSKKTQGARSDALSRFKARELTVLVATDLMSRGIDIQFLPYVINFELPRSPKDYIHRIGRTGRAEASGEAISLITPDEEHHFRVIQKKMKKRVEMINSEDIDLAGY